MALQDVQTRNIIKEDLLSDKVTYNAHPYKKKYKQKKSPIALA